MLLTTPCLVGKVVVVAGRFLQATKGEVVTGGGGVW